MCHASEFSRFTWCCPPRGLVHSFGALRYRVTRPQEPPISPPNTTSRKPLCSPAVSFLLLWLIQGKACFSFPPLLSSWQDLKERHYSGAGQGASPWRRDCLWLSPQPHSAWLNLMQTAVSGYAGKCVSLLWISAWHFLVLLLILKAFHKTTCCSPQSKTYSCIFTLDFKTEEWSGFLQSETQSSSSLWKKSGLGWHFHCWEHWFSRQETFLAVIIWAGGGG